MKVATLEHERAQLRDENMLLAKQNQLVKEKARKEKLKMGEILAR